MEKLLIAEDKSGYSGMNLPNPPEGNDVLVKKASDSISAALTTDFSTTLGELSDLYDKVIELIEKCYSISGRSFNIAHDHSANAKRVFSWIKEDLTTLVKGEGYEKVRQFYSQFNEDLQSLDQEAKLALILDLADECSSTEAEKIIERTLGNLAELSGIFQKVNDEVIINTDDLNESIEGKEFVTLLAELGRKCTTAMEKAECLIKELKRKDSALTIDAYKSLRNLLDLLNP